MALTDDVILKTVGFAVAVGVLADAFLVRLMIVPAVKAIAGERMWWVPGGSIRLLLNLDVEGDGLDKHLAAPAESREDPIGR